MKEISTLEVMNINTKTWSTASPLPHPLAMPSATISEDRLYLAGGFNEEHKESNTVVTCKLSELLKLPPRRQRFLSLGNKKGTWQHIQDLPVIEPTIIDFRGYLLAIGGKTPESQEDTADIYCYHSKTNSWNVVSKMRNKRRRCLAIVLPEDRLLVVGGYNNNTVEIASL